MSIQRILNSDGIIDLQYLTAPTASDPITARIAGITDGSTASEGEVGEYLSAIVVFDDAVSINTLEFIDVAELVLTAGRWLITANILVGQGDQVGAVPLGQGFTAILANNIDSLAVLSLYHLQTPEMQLAYYSAPFAPVYFETATGATIRIKVQSDDGTTVPPPLACGSILASRIA
jgi:hypothetical protein